MLSIPFARETVVSDKDRPEWIKCIADQHVDNAGKAWCGETLFDWHFTGIDHATMNNRNQGRLLPCPDCVAEVVKHLCPTETEVGRQDSANHQG